MDKKIGCVLLLMLLTTVGILSSFFVPCVNASSSLLTFNSKYVITSTTQVTTTSHNFVDDGQAIKTFSLNASKVVLVIYQANCIQGTGMHFHGMRNAINVDGTDHAKSWDSGYGTNYCVRNCIFWVGILGVGSHTISGRFASNTDGLFYNTAVINNRVLIIVIFDGNQFYYIDNDTPSNVTTLSFADDPMASVTFTPASQCKALILYNTGTRWGAESEFGKKIAINVGGTDYARAEKSPGYTPVTDSVFTCHALELSPVQTTVTGRFACAGDTAELVTIDRRQLAVLLLADSTLLDISTSTTQVSTTSSSLVNDEQATLQRTTAVTSDLLVIAMGTKRYGSTSSFYGECYGIKIDGNDRVNSRGSPCHIHARHSNSIATAYIEHLSAGNHTIQGRFSNNYGASASIINARQVIALWFLAPRLTVTSAPMTFVPFTINGFLENTPYITSTAGSYYLVATPELVSNDVPYYFLYWSVDGIPRNNLAVQVTFTGTRNVTAVAHYIMGGAWRRPTPVPAVTGGAPSFWESLLAFLRAHSIWILLLLLLLVMSILLVRRAMRK